MQSLWRTAGRVSATAEHPAEPRNWAQPRPLHPRRAAPLSAPAPSPPVHQAGAPSWLPWASRGSRAAAACARNTGGQKLARSYKGEGRRTAYGGYEAAKLRETQSYELRENPEEAAVEATVQVVNSITKRIQGRNISDWYSTWTSSNVSLRSKWQQEDGLLDTSLQQRWPGSAPAWSRVTGAGRPGFWRPPRKETPQPHWSPSLCWITLPLSKFLVYNRNFLHVSVCPFPLALSLGATEKSRAPSSILATSGTYTHWFGPPQDFSSPQLSQPLSVWPEKVTPLSQRKVLLTGWCSLKESMPRLNPKEARLADISFAGHRIISHACWNWTSLRCPYQPATVSFLTVARLRASCSNNNAATSSNQEGLTPSAERRPSAPHTRQKLFAQAGAHGKSLLRRCLNRTESSDRKSTLLVN